MDRDTIVRLVKPVAAKIARLSVSDRITLLSALVCQEICNLPAGERLPTLRDLMDEMPEILTKTEEGMRQALVGNARDG